MEVRYPLPLKRGISGKHWGCIPKEGLRLQNKAFSTHIGLAFDVDHFLFFSVFFLLFLSFVLVFMVFLFVWGAFLVQNLEGLVILSFGN